VALIEVTTVEVVCVQAMKQELYGGSESTTIPRLEKLLGSHNVLYAFSQISCILGIHFLYISVWKPYFPYPSDDDIFLSPVIF
jgi:hypothetical protein